jgi:mannose-6-phosphate isomerase-like protein (cupin superfamily)
MTKPIRRVVTGHDGAGKSIFIMDGAAPYVRTNGSAGVAVTDLWVTDSAPASNEGSAETTGKTFQIPPPKNGSKFRVIEYPPDKKRDMTHYAADIARNGAARPGEARHPGFHKTNTIDYVIVLSGEIYALMDEGEVLLHTGDVLIQRGTSHAWSNRGEESAYLAFVLIDAEPV